MTRLLLLCSIALMPLISQASDAHKDSITVMLPVIDAFTGEIIEDGQVELLSPDSTLISKGQWVYNTDNDVRTASFALAKLDKEGAYILRLTHSNYFPLYTPINVKLSKRANGYYIPNAQAKMRKRPKPAADVQLGEAVVQATKIKMVMKGDTVVYNADAFQLSQGSMLDALIEQLPGAELKENGVITVNGRQISSLLVNGKDFFRGDPKIALDNLPAYMVDKVKVYERQTDLEKMTGHEELKRPLVMDVNLKKQYSVGWIANAEAAYGTEDKWLGRLFAMRFTDCSRLAVFGNANNTNDTRRPGSRGEWTPSYLPSGLQTSRSGGAEYYYENRLKTFEWTSDLNAAHTDNHTFTATSSESFLPSSRAYTLTERDNRSHATSASTSHRYKVQKQARQTGNVYFHYEKNRGVASDRAGEFSDDPYTRIGSGLLDSLFLPGATALRELARYRRSQAARSHGDSWGVSGMPYSLWWMPLKSRGLGDMLFLDLSGSYDRHTTHTYDRYSLEYAPLGSDVTDQRNRYQHRESRHYSYNTRLAYAMYLGQLWPMFTYRYGENYNKGRRDLFRLDRLDGWGADTEYPLGTLPSAVSDMQQALDLQNSEHSELWKRTHQIEARVEYRTKSRNRTSLLVEVPVRVELHHLLYDRNRQAFDLHRTKTTVTPHGYVAQEVNRGDKSMELKLEYYLSRWIPELENDIDILNDADPLYVQHGNANLKTSTTHSLTFEASARNRTSQLFNLRLFYQRTHDAFATERTYNPQTGGYTVRPVNVNGNWRTEGDLSLSRQFGKRKDFTWSSNTSYSFDHNVDMANVDGTVTNGLSTIKSLYLREQFSVSYSRKGWNLGARLRGSHNRLTGKRSDFSAISAWDYNYGLTARIPLPGKIGLSTDFTVFSRRGYDDPGLNTDNFIWNVRAERSVLDGNLTFIIDGLDILHDLSNVTRTVNAQGRTESYTNVIPSYFMARVIYRLNVQPKKKN